MSENETLTQLERRLDALEAENHRLRRQVMSTAGDRSAAPVTLEPAAEAQSIDRRSALRNLGAAAAAGVGLMAAGSATRPSIAHAADYDPLTIGINNVGTDQTKLTSGVQNEGNSLNSGEEGAFRVEADGGGGVAIRATQPTSYAMVEDGTSYAYPALGVTPAANPPGRRGAAGDLISVDRPSDSGIKDLYYFHTGEEKFVSTVGRVHTAAFSNYLTFGTSGGAAPRVMDTRSNDASLRPSGAKASGGKLDSGVEAFYTMDVTDAVASDCVAVLGTLTATGANENGFLTAWGGGEQPTASNLNYNGQDLSTATLALIPLSVASDGTKTFRIATKTGRPTHVLFDLLAQVVRGVGAGGTFDFAGDPVEPAAAAASISRSVEELTR